MIPGVRNPTPPRLICDDSCDRPSVIAGPLSGNRNSFLHSVRPERSEPVGPACRQWDVGFPGADHSRNGVPVAIALASVDVGGSPTSDGTQRASMRCPPIECSNPNSMTRSHRQRHRWIWIAIAALLPLVFLSALAARRPVPVMSGYTRLLTPPPTNLAPR